VLTEETVAEKLAVVAPAATVTEAGTVTDELLLARLTENPPVAAAAFSATVQASVAAPVTEELEQEIPVNAGTPVPLREMAAVPLVEELLAMVSVPLAAPAAVGSNWTVSVAVWLGFSVSGKVAPETEKPVPVSVAELTVTAAVPVEDSVTDCEVVVFTARLPKLTLEVLTVRVGMAAFNWRAKLCELLLAFAVSAAVCVVLTAETVAAKFALAAPAGTVTEAGTTTAELLLARFTVTAPLGAALRVTVHASVPAPVIVGLEQESAVGLTTEGELLAGVRSATICVIHEPEALIDALAV
jgi:hypothetical protein